MHLELIEFVIDPQTQRAHVEDHGVSRAEVLEVLDGPTYDSAANNGARAAVGQTSSGRILRVIYRRKAPRHVLVITAYEADRRTKKRFHRNKR